MIKVNGINNKEFVINADQIEKIEEGPQSVITIMNGNKYIVIETVDEIIDKVVRYKNRIFSLKL